MSRLRRIQLEPEALDAVLAHDEVAGGVILRDAVYAQASQDGAP